MPLQPAGRVRGALRVRAQGGLHTSALGKAGGATYEHVDPDVVGNGTRFVVSELGGRVDACA